MDTPAHDEILEFLERTAKRFGAEGFMLYLALPDDALISITAGTLGRHRQRIAQELEEYEDQVLIQ